MDVRCEKCQTEYELDEARLKPGGVTVKCTNCGHMFKIRKRASTDVGPAVSAGSSGASIPASVSAAQLAAAQAAATVVDRARSPSSRGGTSANDKVTVVGPGAAIAPGGQLEPATVVVKVPTDPSAPGAPPPQAAPQPVSDAGSGAIAAPAAGGTPSSEERQWLVRLDNGETKSCRELATLQQWIVSGLVTRESLISRSGKTWKRLGDIAELTSYFAIADEANALRAERNERAERNTRPPEPRRPPVAGAKATIMGVGAAASAAGGTILPDDGNDDGEELEIRRPMSVPPPPPRNTRTPPMGGAVVPPRTMPPPPLAVDPARILSSTPAHGTDATSVPRSAPARRPTTQPPPPPAKRATATPYSGVAEVPASNRSTAGWANEAVRAIENDEPAFASGKLGTIRGKPGDDAVFASSRLRTYDDDDDVIAAPKGSSSGKWIAVGALLVMGAVAAAIYFAVIRKPTGELAVRDGSGSGSAIGSGSAAAVTSDAGTLAAAGDAGAAPPGDAGATVTSVSDIAAAELGADVEPKLRAALTALDGHDDAAAIHARLATALAQDLQDRAGLTADHTEAETLRRDARQLVLDNAPLAQRALKTNGADASANLAMANVLRLQGKSAREIKRYLDAARAAAGVDKALVREAALADALTLARDGKLADAQAAFAAIDAGDDALDKSGDVRARFHEALALAALGKTADAKPLVEQILAAQPEHVAARALQTRLATAVATSDPLPPEDGHPAHPNPNTNPNTGSGTGPVTAIQGPGSGPGPGPAPEGDYDKLVAKANQTAESNCDAALKAYEKALDARPNGVEALVGMGYCHIDAKQFASAFGNFRSALAISPHNERALWGIAEAYQQQGRKEQAAESYKAYLEVYPESAAAKKQLERLTGDAPAPTPPAPPPTPPANGGGAPVTSPSAGSDTPVTSP